MKNFLKGKFGTVVILLFTVVLAGVAIFTALRLYQLRQEPVAPNVPSSIPRAAENTCTLSFTLLAASPSPTAAAPSSSPTATPAGGATPTGSSTATSTAAPTSTPAPSGVSRTSVPAPTPTAPSLPTSGTDWPTIVGAGIGVFVIIGSLLLAL